MEFILLGGLAGLVAVMSRMVHQWHYQLTQLQELRRQTRTMLEIRKSDEFKKMEFKEKQELAERAIETGTTTVESIHQIISGLTFGILESIPATSLTSRLVREIHDKTAGTIYSTIRTVNRQIGELANDMVGAANTSTSTEASEN
ncbi:MAG: hypothetical protein HQM11_01305 [SAR324 cluster bacterium]|nr:hypothetical protein [SAR324 cluster bacterium]